MLLSARRQEKGVRLAVDRSGADNLSLVIDARNIGQYRAGVLAVLAQLACRWTPRSREALVALLADVTDLRSEVRRT